MNAPKPIHIPAISLHQPWASMIADGDGFSLGAVRLALKTK